MNGNKRVKPLLSGMNKNKKNLQKIYKVQRFCDINLKNIVKKLLLDSFSS